MFWRKISAHYQCTKEIFFRENRFCTLDSPRWLANFCEWEGPLRLVPTQPKRAADAGECEA
jgi:hypothetical protein